MASESADPGRKDDSHNNNVTRPIDWDDIWELGGWPRARIAITAQLYIYCSADKGAFVRDYCHIPTSGYTWLTPNVFDSASEAEQKLALPSQPIHRLGPFWSLEIVFDGIGLRISPPRFNQPGGGWELTTTRRIPFGERSTLK